MASLARTSTRGTTAMVVVSLVAAVTLQVARDRLAPPRQAGVPTLWLQSPEAARRIMLSFTDLAADVYWMRAVVHYGGERRLEGAERFQLLYPLLDMATTLDPLFDVAARMGAIFLSEGYPGGPGRPDRAIQLLEKGLSHDPLRWQYHHDIGFVNYWWLKDYAEAARQFERGSQLPNAPEWLRTMAAVTLARGGDREAARKLWSEMLVAADVDWIRRAATYGLQQLRALDDLDGLRARVQRVTEQTGAAPRTWEAVIAAGWLTTVPTDPTGVPYQLDGTGTVTLGSGSGLAPLPVLGTTK
jgi:tetratricopeptide (TPR) repeat protein